MGSPISLFTPLFTSRITSHFGVALRFSGEMLRENSKNEKKIKKRKIEILILLLCVVFKVASLFAEMHTT